MEWLLLFILLPTAVSFYLITELGKTKMERDIYYSNYRNCLLALKEHDKDLAKYLEREERKRKHY